MVLQTTMYHFKSLYRGGKVGKLLDPNKCCETCAFGGKGGARDEIYNRLKGLICAHSGRPFFCHHGRDGSEYDWRNGKLGFMALPPNQRRLCAGWKAMVRQIFTRGGHMDIRAERVEDRKALYYYQRALGIDAIVLLDEIVASKATDKSALHAKLKDRVRAIFASGAE